jgi:hypothetical protein
MDILIVDTSKYWDPFDEVWHADLRYLVSFLRRHNIDAGFTFLPTLESPCQLIQHNGGVKPNAVFLDLTEDNHQHILRFLKPLSLALPETRILLGGIAATLSPQDMLNQYEEIDFIVAGERELTLLETTERLRKGERINNVLGIYSRDFEFAPRPLMPDLDILGNIIHDGLEESLCGKEPEERVAYLINGRGCYANCSFCAVPEFYRHTLGRRWRGRSVEAVVDELQLLEDRFQIRRFAFQDDNFFGPGPAGQERARQFAAEVLRRDLEIKYFISCRLNDINAETFSIMKESGLSRIGVGVESVNQQSLRLFEKGYMVDTIYPTLDLIEELRLPCEVNMIFFEPHMTLSAVRANLAFFKYLRDKEYIFYSDAFPFNILYASHWSRVAARLKSEGLLDEKSSTCRFRDPAVAQLVDFIGRLSKYMPSLFKRRLLVDNSDSLPKLSHDGKVLNELTWVSEGIRQWVGLTVMPRFLTAACDALEHRAADATKELDELDELFKKKMEVLHVLEGRISEVMRKCHLSSE